jgi:hypothetical protein
VGRLGAPSSRWVGRPRVFTAASTRHAVEGAATRYAQFVNSGPPPRDPRDDPGRLTARVRPSDRRVVERVRSAHPGDKVVRIRRAKFQGFSRTGEGHLAAGAQIEEPTGLARVVKRWLVGAPIHSDLESHERLPKRKAIAVFSSDALSSVADTPQETLVILLTAGLATAWWSLPIAIGVVLLLATVVTSYRQSIYAYPSGDGSYIVAHANLGELAGLTAAS